MPLIAELAGQRGELSDCQTRVLETLEGNSDHVFRSTPEDLIEIKRLLTASLGDAPGRPFHAKAIKSALKVLHMQGKIGLATVHHEKYYGSHAAIERLEDALSRSAA